MEPSSIRILIVDDYLPWRRFVCSKLQNEPDLKVVGELSDGLQAVQRAQELQPDLILLDIGLPKLNGIEAARQIRECAPRTKILFLSENRSFEIVEEALRYFHCGYVAKSDAGKELLAAVRAVLQGQQFVSASLPNHSVHYPAGEQIGQHDLHKKVLASVPLSSREIRHSHEIGFYRDDASLVDDFARFVSVALKAGKVVITLMTESHHTSVLEKLEADGVEVRAAIEHGIYIPFNVADALSSFMVNDLPDRGSFFNTWNNLMAQTAGIDNIVPRRVAACGECAPHLWQTGNPEAAVQLERLWAEVARIYKADIFCGYVLSELSGTENDEFFSRIRAEHLSVRPGLY